MGLPSPLIGSPMACDTLPVGGVNLKRKVFAVGIAVLAAFTMVAQEKKEPAKKAASPAGILHPEMKVETGTWDKPVEVRKQRPADRAAGQGWVAVHADAGRSCVGGGNTWGTSSR